MTTSLSILLLAALGASPLRAATRDSAPHALLHPAERSPLIEVDQFELGAAGSAIAVNWDAATHFALLGQGFTIESVGEGELGSGIEAAEAAAYWTRPIGAVAFVVGIRHDLGPVRATFLTAGVRDVEVAGLELSGSAFLSARGRISARMEAERDLSLGARLIAQPSVQLDFGATGRSPLSSAELGMRLRYQTRSAVSPYIGVEYQRSFDRASPGAEPADDPERRWAWLVGLTIRR